MATAAAVTANFDSFLAAAALDDPVRATDAKVAEAFKLLIAFYNPHLRTHEVIHLDAGKDANGRKILAAAPDVQFAVVKAALAIMLQPPKGKHLSQTKYEPDESGEFVGTKIYKAYDESESDRLFALRNLLRELLRRQFPFTAAELTTILKGLRQDKISDVRGWVPWALFIRCIQRAMKGQEIPAALANELVVIRNENNSKFARPEEKRIAVVIDEMLGKTAPPPPLKPGEAWSDAALQAIAASSPAAQSAWGKLLKHAQTAMSSKPSGKWLKEAKPLVDALGTAVFSGGISQWFTLLDLPRTQTLPHNERSWHGDPNLLIEDVNATFLKGLAWSCSSLSDASVASALGDSVFACFKKIRMHGPRCPKVGNACLFALASMTIPEATAQLARIDSVMKQHTGKKMVGRAIGAVAARTGQTPEDLAEQSTPTFELDDDSTLTRKVGPFTATLAITGSTDADLTFASDGKTHKTIPAEVKRDHADALKQLQKTQKDIEKMLAAHKMRIERLLMGERSWSVGDWRARYLDHPLLANLSRRLIWKFDDKTPAIFKDGKLVASNGKPVKVSDDSRVSLWHPIHATADEVRQWRSFLEASEIRQPFKQAHREIYVLTDAERRTRTYSNRFAGHIVRQHQLVALCKQRGWKAWLMGSWDDGGAGIPTLELPQWKFNVTFHVDGADAATSQSGVALHLATDRVEFYPSDNEDAQRGVRLDTIPPLVFSEVMRDVDLFVAVTSIGAQADWTPRNQPQAFNNYWRDFAFGDLSEGAKVRKATLEALLPKLKISSQCRLDGKFLVVKGKLRTYKIHLGSGNILMEPNDQYLCIVPNRNLDSGTVFLPYEGDSTLSIILSKALLLADDESIDDETILRQIK